MFIGRHDGECILSKEGTTQGDPLARAMCALSTVPLINKLESLATQVWFADDAAAAGSLVDLLNWWKQLSTLGLGYGYYMNAVKSWLVVKEFDEVFLVCRYFPSHYHRGSSLFRGFVGLPRIPFYLSPGEGFPGGEIQLSKFVSSQPHATLQ